MRELVSICIPVYEMNGLGIQMFKNLMESIKIQSYLDFIQVVVSDHSKEKIFEDICKQFNFNIKYIAFCEKYNNGPANTNNAIKNADGSIIKTIFQDDFLIEWQSIEKMVNYLKSSNTKWMACGCLHTDINGLVFERPHIPIWGGMGEDKSVKSYIEREQKIGCPSIIMFKKDLSLEFNEKITMLMDYDFYYKLGKLYGEPSILNEYLVAVRVWSGSITSRTGYGNNDKEKNIMLEMYK
jgi:hypothetical protein